MRILFINQPISEYGQSLLYDGLRRLGHEVLDFPYNYRFHFAGKEECQFYPNCADGPCSKRNEIGCSNHPAHISWTNSHPFETDPDLIVTNNGYGNESIHRYFRDKKVPIAALDLGDSPYDSYGAWTNVIGGQPDFFFRREYFKGQPGYPLPYACYDNNLQFKPREELKHTVSFLFRPTNPVRIEMAESLKKINGSFVGEVPHSQYLDILSKSMFSVAVKGAGFDTLRRWEVPGQGAVLCTERWPLAINNDFEDGKNCIQFDSPSELVSKIEYYLNSSDSVYNILRQNCYEHLSKYHTTSARAKEFLRVCGFNE